MIVVSGLCACVAGPLPVFAGVFSGQRLPQSTCSAHKEPFVTPHKRVGTKAGLGFANATPGVRTSTGQHKGHPAHGFCNVNSSDRRIVMVGLP